MMSDQGGSSVESNGTNENQKLPKTIGIELDVDLALAPDRDSEAESDDNNADWVQHALHTKQRLLSEGHHETTNDVKKISQGLQLVGELEVPTTTSESLVKVRLPKYADTYELEKFRKNAMIIFNHERFLGHSKPRTGTRQDQEELQKTFLKLNFIVEAHLDLTKEKLLKRLKEFSTRDFTDYGCICVAIMTHGQQNGRLRAYDRYLYDQEIIECFDIYRNQSLFGKPIIFLIQVSRGDKPAIVNDMGSHKQVENFDNDSEIQYALPMQSNMLIFNSTYFGQTSVRPDHGSWFIQTLCKKISLLADTEDFLSICRAVQKEIALNKYIKATNSERVKMPVVTSLLIRRLFLRKFEGSNDVDHPGSTSAVERLEETIGKASLSMLPVNNPASRADDDKLEHIIKRLSAYTRDNPRDDVALYILENARNTKLTGSTREKLYAQDLIERYIKHNASNKYMSHGPPCWCGGQDPLAVKTRVGRILSQCGPAVYCVLAAAMVCVVLIKYQKV